MFSCRELCAYFLTPQSFTTKTEKLSLSVSPQWRLSVASVAPPWHVETTIFLGEHENIMRGAWEEHEERPEERSKLFPVWPLGSIGVLNLI